MEEIPGLETRDYIPRGISVELPDAFGRPILEELLHRLVERDPEIARSFSL